MKKLCVGHIMAGPVGTNCYYIFREGADHCIFIDPADNGRYLFEEVKARGLEISAILLTHAHFDHISGGDELKALSGAKIYCPEDDKEMAASPEANASLMFTGMPSVVRPDVYVKDGDVLNFGENGLSLSCSVIATPGHTPGSVCYYFKEDKLLISGDTLFEGSVGRTDLPGGSGAVLSRSIREKLLPLPDDTSVLPGHGGFTTIGDERLGNPFFV